MSDREDPVEAESHTLRLIGGHELVVQRGAESNVLQIVKPDGSTGIVVSITADHIELRIHGAGLTLHSSGALAIDAESLALHGRSDVSITSGGDARIEALGALRTEARVQHVKSTRGNVNIKANDDVQIDGERIRLNS